MELRVLGRRRRGRRRRAAVSGKASAEPEKTLPRGLLRGQRRKRQRDRPDAPAGGPDAGRRADVITLGNHSFDRREICTYLDDCPYILRPGNLRPSLPGRGWGVFETKIGPVGVMNLLGRCNLDFRPDNPFLIADKILQELGEVPVFLDFHAEATSEKLALAYQLDGKIAAQWGTHTHVQTADEQILPNGTGYLTDLGMTGPVRSVIGVRPEQSIANFRGELTSRYGRARPVHAHGRGIYLRRRGKALHGRRKGEDP